MTPGQAIGMLDRQMAAHGSTVTFWRGADTRDMKAVVRSFHADEFVGLLQQGDRKVVVSPTSFGAFGAPEAQDRVIIAEQPFTVQTVELVEIAGVVVRANLVVRGD